MIKKVFAGLRGRSSVHPEWKLPSTLSAKSVRSTFRRALAKRPIVASEDDLCFQRKRV